MFGIAWWQLPAILNWGVTQFLQEQGLTNINLQISEVGSSKALINRFEATYPDSDTMLQIQLNLVSLGYTLPQLMAGKVESLSIDRIGLTLDHQPDEQVSTPPTLPTIDMLLAAYNAVDASNVPLNTLQLPNISISHNLASESVSTFGTVELQAELTKQANQLKAKVLFANQQQISWIIDQDNGWDIQYFNTPTPETDFIASINQVDESLVFNADIKSQLLQRWLPLTPFAETAIKLSDIALSGTIKGNNSMPGLALLSTIQAQSLDYQDWKIQTINGQLDMQIAQVPTKPNQAQANWQINVESKSSITLNGASFSDWQADDLALNLSGDVSLTQNLTKVNSQDILLSIGKLHKADQLELAQTSFEGTVSGLIDAQQWQLNVAELWQLTSQHSRNDEIELPQGWVLTATQPWYLKGAFQTDSQTTSEPDDTLFIENTSLKITIPELQDTSSAQRIHPLNGSLQIDQARINQDKLYAKALLAIPQLTISNNATDQQVQNDWHLDNVSQAFEFNNDLLTSRGSAQSLERELTIETTSKHDFKQQLGSSEFRFKTIEFNDHQQINKLITPNTSPVDLVAGEVDLSGQARWHNIAGKWQVMVYLDAQLNNLGGSYDETYFSGANGQLTLQVYPQILSEKSQKLNIAHLDAGVANKDIVIEFKLTPSKFGDLPIVDIQKAQTHVLLGSVKLKPTAYDLNRTQQSLQVVVDNIDLNELVTLQQLDDVQATGLVSGLLPISINDGQISIDDGKLQAMTPGGVLRYQANADALQANEYAETVALALRNFHYKVLNADTQYKPDGTLFLSLQLQGNNPDFEQGRQINLNINLEQNLLKLLESLRLYEGVSDKLDKRVRDYYQ